MTFYDEIGGHETFRRIVSVFYREVVDGTWAGCLLMLARNGLLGAAAVLSFVRLWRSARPPAGKTVPATEPRPDSDRLPDRALSVS